MSSGVLSRAVALLLISLVGMLSAVPGGAGSLKGKVKKGVYEAPGKIFRVPVPGGIGMRVNDGFEHDPQAGDIGGVSFHDDFGNLKMISYASLPGVPNFPESTAEYQMLEAFVQQVAMPAWFVPASPKAEILHMARVPFEGKRALLALVSLPGAAPLSDATGKRMDSTRGLVTLYRGRWVFVFGKETKPAVWALVDSTRAAPDSAWASFAGDLGAFYRTVTFAD